MQDHSIYGMSILLIPVSIAIRKNKAVSKSFLYRNSSDLTEEQIHKTLWKEYEISGADRMFVERASKILEQYEGESEDEK